MTFIVTPITESQFKLWAQNWILHMKEVIIIIFSILAALHDIGTSGKSAIVHRVLIAIYIGRLVSELQ